MSLGVHTSVAAQAADWARVQALPFAGAVITADSRRVRPGDVFMAYPGIGSDGRTFIADALKRGASGVLMELVQIDGERTDAQFAVHPKSLAVEQLGQRSGEIAALFFGEPSRSLSVIAITGTSGKTSCSTWLAQLLSACGQPCAFIGTRGAGMVDSINDFGLTTPDAVLLQQFFSEFVAKGASAVAIEASSIGLEQGRLGVTKVDTAVFTNLSQDHLDYHGNLIAYAQAKAKLFARPELKVAVLNRDDAQYTTMQSVLGPNVQQIIFSLDPFVVGHQDAKNAKVARLFARQIKFQNNSISFEIDGDFGCESVTIKLAGRFNIANVLAITACALARGIDLKTIAQHLPALEPVQGRMQALGGIGEPLAIVDYAHKPDALEKVLLALRDQANARGAKLWCVFGCGGNRDSSKRAVMGEIAERLADHVVVTSDNPRLEDPQAIVDQILSGFKRAPKQVQLDRRSAIEFALNHCADQDVILVAGKGHEAYQEVLGVKHPFSDLETVQGLLGQRNKSLVASTIVGGRHV
jgi:UDP-N-acetylmuramoyl-L-alanyl-D-glutamate--2,6-diaminopimelate ligase